LISSALYRLFGRVQISSVGFLPLSIWTKYFGQVSLTKAFPVGSSRLPPTPEVAVLSRGVKDSADF